MAIVSIDRKIFEKEIGRLDEKMQERIALFGTPIGTITDTELQIEIFPNRPDLLSYHGFKRSFLAFLGKKIGLKEYNINKPEKNYRVIIDSSVKNVRPFTACAIIKDLSFNDEKIKEVIELQEKIHTTLGRKRKKLAIGVYPLEKIKLPITFKAIEPDKIKFIPLEYDKEFSGLQILQKHPAGRDYAHLLAGKEKFPIFVDAENNILSMPPIINSQLTGKIIAETKDVFIECSGFDFPLLKKCLNILVTALAEMGGKIFQIEIYESGLTKKIKAITPDLTPEKIKISVENANKLLGININEKQMKILIEKMGHNFKRPYVEIPAWRTDILHKVDIIEDIAIAYGYENFIPEIPGNFAIPPKHESWVANREVATIMKENKNEIIKRKISEILQGLGFLEISNYHLTKKQDQFTKMGIQEKKEKGFVEVTGSKTEFNILRKDLSHYALKILSENIDNEYPQKIFELGVVFEEKNSKITEEEKLSIALAPGNFTDIKQIFEYISRMAAIDLELKFQEPKTESQTPKHFIDGRVAEISISEKIIGYLGEIHPKILKDWKIKMPVALIEISLEEIFKNKIT